MQPADADALTTLYAHNLAVSPLDLAVWPGHDGECRCRVQAGHVPPGPSEWPSLALLVLLDDIHGLLVHPTNRALRSYWADWLKHDTRMVVNRQSSEVDMIYHISCKLQTSD